MNPDLKKQKMRAIRRLASRADISRQSAIGREIDRLLGDRTLVEHVISGRPIAPQSAPKPKPQVLFSADGVASAPKIDGVPFADLVRAMARAYLELHEACQLVTDEALALRGFTPLQITAASHEAGIRATAKLNAAPKKELLK